VGGHDYVVSHNGDTVANQRRVKGALGYHTPKLASKDHKSKPSPKQFTLRCYIRDAW